VAPSRQELGTLNAYFDASVILRIVNGEPGRLAGWGEFVTRVCSELVEVECKRALERMRHNGVLTINEEAERREAVDAFLDTAEIQSVTKAVLRRAAGPMPLVLGTLDAVHLSTAMIWQESRGESLAMATHDKALARAARAYGLEVVGI
jgi:predicted nucleic acid-binding protein